MNTWEITALIYLTGLSTFLFFGLLIYTCGSKWTEKRDGARLILTSSIWPAVLITLIVRYIIRIIEDADLRDWKHRR